MSTTTHQASAASSKQEASIKRRHCFLVRQLLGCHLWPLIRKANRPNGYMDMQDFDGQAPKSLSLTCDQLSDRWEAERKQRNKPNLRYVMWNQFWGQLLLAMGTIILREMVVDNLMILYCWRALSHVVVLTENPLSDTQTFVLFDASNTTLKINHTELYQESWVQLELEILIIVGLCLVHLLLLAVHLNITYKMAHQWRICLINLVYKKLLKIANLKQASQAINLMTRDIDSLTLELQDLFIGLACPTGTIVTVYASITYLGTEISLMVFCANMMLGFIRVSLMVHHKITGRIASALTDKRLGYMSEILQGLQVLRMLAWTDHAIERIQEARVEELKKKKRIVLCYVYDLFLSYILSIIIVVVTFFMGYMYMHLEMSLPTIGMMIVVNIVYRRFFSRYLSNAIKSSINLSTIFLRIQDYLAASEIVPVTRRLLQTGDVVLEVNDLLLSWPENNNNGLVWSERMSFRLRQGELLIVGGSVGSGKSSLLKAVIGELPVSAGSLILKPESRLSFASQKPWIFSGTIRDNILFGSPMKRERYAQVLKVSALALDLATWEQRDLVQVGERGVMLSGGQKARINIARCLYQEADLYVMDDPLSAVDARVAHHLFYRAIKSFLSSKTVILASHQQQFFKEADKILWLEKSSPSLCGTYEEMRKSKLVLNLQVNNLPVDECLAVASQLEETIIKSITSSIQSKIHIARDGLEEVSLPEEDSKHQLEKSNFWNAIGFYFEQGGKKYDAYLVIPCEFLIICLQFGCLNWIIEWAMSNESQVVQGSSSREMTDLRYVITITATTLGMYICSCMLRFVRMYLVHVRAMESIHQLMINSILRTDLFFHNSTPHGKLTYRISNDIEYLDLILIRLYIESSFNLVPLLSACINTIIYAPLFLLVPILYYLAVHYFFSIISNLINASNDVMSLRKSRMYSQVSVTLDGLSTIRADAKQESFMKRFHVIKDKYASSCYMVSQLQNLTWSLMAFGTLVFSLSNAAIFLSEVYRGHRMHVVMGINTFIIFARNNASVCQYLLDFYMNSRALMRLKQYCILRPEFVREPDEPPPLQVESLENSSIVFMGVSMRYFRQGQLVLKDVSFKIEAGQKVGVIGRTGSGKSSLVAVLLRLYRFEGLVFIDGKDTKQLDLDSLRRCISCIPQEPTMFNGTIKSNLDPSGERTDAEIWQALRAVQLSTVVARMRDLLEAEVADLGGNFSVGQRQLFCLARAILRRTKILILDEATASVDQETDALIQQTIRREFVTSTVLTIAHRLSTIIDSDKIMVIDKGRLCEFGTPKELLRANGLFAAMIESSGYEAEALKAQILKHQPNKSTE